VSRYISPPPPTVEAFDRFIAWSEQQRQMGMYASFAVVPRGTVQPIGLFQLRAVESGFAAAEWGFAIAPEFWGSGVFVDGARLVVDFAFETLGARRLEARSAVRNLRGNGALHKIGALHEATMRQSFMRGGELFDQALWTILADDWLDPRIVERPCVVH
jgi:[ribosomal protein S5]-alanine N-acetyltransferase